MRVCLVDVETTGVNPTKDRVCEIAWRVIDNEFNTVDSDVSLINPGMSIPSGASAVNGISDIMVRDALGLAEYIESVGRPFEYSDLVFVAHNSKFDYSFLKAFVHPEARQLCTLRASRLIYPDADSHKQAALAYSLGLEIDRTKVHSAEGDLDILQQLLGRLLDDSRLDIEGLIALSMSPRMIERMPFGKHKGEALTRLPRQYVSWLLNEATIDDDLRASLMAL